MIVKISEIKEGDIKKAYQFCIGIFEELSWDKRFDYGLDNLKEFFSGPREIFFIAKKGKEIIGCGGLKELSENQGLMKRFYVARDFRGKGIARLIFKEIKGFAKKQGYKFIILDTFRTNFRAKRFYEKQGFKPFIPKPDKDWKESKRRDLFDFRKLTLN